MRKILSFILIACSFSTIALADCQPIEFAEANTYTIDELLRMREQNLAEVTRIRDANMRIVTDNGVKNIRVSAGGPRSKDEPLIDDKTCISNAALALRIIQKGNRK